MRAFVRQPEFSVAQLINHTYTLNGDSDTAITIEAANVDRYGNMLLLIRKSEANHEHMEWVALNTFMIWLNLNQAEMIVD